MVFSVFATRQHWSPNTGGETEAQILERWPATYTLCISDEGKASASFHLPVSFPALMPDKFLAKASYALHPLGTARANKQGFKAISKGCPSPPDLSASQTSQGLSTTLGMTGMTPILCRIHQSQDHKEKIILKGRNLPSRSAAVCKDIFKNCPMELTHPVLSSFQGFYQFQQTSLSPLGSPSTSTHCREKQRLGNPPFAPDLCNPPCRFQPCAEHRMTSSRGGGKMHPSFAK